jgi:hypothetical protein
MRVLGAWGKKQVGEAKVKYLLMSFIWNIFTDYCMIYPCFSFSPSCLEINFFECFIIHCRVWTSVWFGINTHTHMCIRHRVQISYIFKSHI